LRAAFGDDAIGDEPIGECRFEQSFQQPADAAVALARRHFNEHIPGMTPDERIDRAGNVGLRQIEPGARDQFERGQLVGAGGAGMGEEAHRILDPGEAEKRGLDFARLWEQF
jgi:hypothetical protein